MKDISWRTPEYRHRERGSDWYWTVGIITAALVVMCIIFGNTLFALVLAIGAFMFSFFGSQKPKVVDVEVGSKGITIDKTRYPYLSLDSFGTHDIQDDEVRIILKSKKVLMPLIAIPAPADQIDEIREILAAHLKEEAFEQSFTQTIFERFGF